MSMLSFLYRQIRSEVRALIIIEPRTPLNNVSQAGTLYIIKITHHEWSFYFGQGAIEMEKEHNNKLGFLSILTIIFVIAKLLGLIHWSWLLVFAPTLIGIGVWILIMLVALIIAVVSGE